MVSFTSIPFLLFSLLTDDIVSSFQGSLGSRTTLTKLPGAIPTNNHHHHHHRHHSRFQTSTLHVSTPIQANNDLQTSTSTQHENEFDWYKTWHPLVPIEYLDPSKPHKFTLLGIDVVVWNDSAESSEFKSKKELKKTKKLGKGKRSKFRNLFRKNKDDDFSTSRSDSSSSFYRPGQWRVFSDKCPHRLVPLSEGRIESDGSLLCSYHGWRFDGDGDCIGLPQTSTQEELLKIQSTPKSQCNSFPVKVVNDILWVWPTSGSDARIQSELVPVPVHQIINHEDGTPIPEESIIYNSYNFRELPYGADYFLENVVDPAHVPVSHHNVVGDRYTGAKPISMKTIQPMTKDGFVLNVFNSDNDNGTRQGFKAPCLVSIDSQVTPEGARQILELYVSPSRPGFCNHVGRLVMVKDENGVLPQGFKQFTLPIPVWMNHLLAATFLNQDGLFLHTQERALHHDFNYKSSSSINDMDDDRKNPSYKEMVFTPTEADKGVILFRDWLRLKAGGKIPFTSYQGMPPVDKNVVFDQWDSHTSKCKYCLDAYKNTKKVRLSSAMLAVAVGVIRPRGVVATLISVGVLGGISFASHKLIGAFHRQEFSHANND